MPLIVTLSLLALAGDVSACNRSVQQSAREIPLVAEADVLVVGGTVGAVAAATEAARGGARVWLVAAPTYLGEDLCATLRLWRDATRPPAGELTRAMFGDRGTTTPLQVKRELEAALLEADVQFLFGSFPTDVLLDGDGRPAAVVIANRAGRQAIACKTIIDATDRAVVARLAGSPVRTSPARSLAARRIVLGGRPTSSIEPARSIPAGTLWQGEELQYHEYELELEFDGSAAPWAEAEQRARDLTYRDGQLRAAERLVVTWPDPIVGQLTADDWRGVEAADLRHFRPRGIERLYVIGGCADVPRDQVAEILEPDNHEALGRRIGKQAAGDARTATGVDGDAIAQIRVGELSRTESPPWAPDADGDVREILQGLRPTDQPDRTVTLDRQSVPVLAEVEVVVIGGGTAGACAAIGAARAGATVLVVEYQEALGGVGTLGLIGRPYHGRNAGFSREVPFPDREHNMEHKMEWFRREIRASGGKIWLGAIGCGAWVREDRVAGAVVVTPRGRGVVLADVVIDATGSADVVIAAGAASMYGGDRRDIALQGSGLPLRPLSATYVNTDYLLVDEADALDTWRALVGVRLTSDTGAYDIGAFIQNRERRRVVGDHVLQYLDQIAGRTYPDSIVLSASNYDSHGYPSDIYFALIPHTEKTLKANHPAPGGSCYTPYRCLLPTGLDGILVAGLGISMHRDASAMVRMQKDMHNQGYAAGVAAAMAVRAGCTPRALDVRQLQEHLVEIGNLPESVLSDRDSFPLPGPVVKRAVAALADASLSRDAVCEALAIVLSHRDDSIPWLRAAFESAQGSNRLEFAKVLGVLGQTEVVPELIEALEQVTEWDDKIFQGSMAEYAHLPTPIDALILALGHTRDRRAVPAILAKLETLDAEVTLSHHRAVALALEEIADPAAAEPLARLLDKPGMRGHAMPALEPLYDRVRDRRRREGPLREIVLARALYRCGDHQGLGETILHEYQQDLRGLFARHAQAVLQDGP